jgi:hypothetical protein
MAHDFSTHQGFIGYVKEVPVLVDPNSPLWGGPELLIVDGQKVIVASPKSAPFITLDAPNPEVARLAKEAKDKADQLVKEAALVAKEEQAFKDLLLRILDNTQEPSW